MFDELAKLGCKYGDLDELKRIKRSRVSWKFVELAALEKGAVRAAHPYHVI